MLEPPKPRTIEDVIKDLREKPFNYDISEFVIGFDHKAPHLSAGISHSIDFIMTINKKRGGEEEIVYNSVFGCFVHYCDRNEDLTDKDVDEIVERNYKEIESRFPESMLKRDGDKLVIDGGFLYIPPLNAYVGKHPLKIDDKVRKAAGGIDVDLSHKSDSCCLTHVNWYQAEEIVKRLGSRMLKPSEFWVFYDYLEKKDIHLWVDALGNHKLGEWIGGLVIDRDKLVFNSKDLKDIKKHKKVNVILEDGIFGRGGVDGSNGLPYKLDGFERIYTSPKSDLTAVCFHYKEGHRPVFDLSLPPDYKDKDCDYKECRIGVREILDAPKVEVEQKKEKQLTFDFL